MRRNRWKAGFAGVDLEEPAQKWVDYHRAHEAYWSDEFDRLDEEYGRSLKVGEQPVTGGKQRVAQFDQGLQTQANEARSRRDRHRSEAEGYDAFVILFNRKPQQTFVLDADDAAYFFTEPPDDVPVKEVRGVIKVTPERIAQLREQDEE